MEGCKQLDAHLVERLVLQLLQNLEYEEESNLKLLRENMAEDSPPSIQP
jgi:hypothetical protein